MAGSSRLTAAGVLGVSGKPVRVFGYTMRSNNTGPGIIILYDGTDTTGTERWRGQGNTDFSADKQFSHQGKFFAGGCYVDFDVDADVLYVDFDYEQVTI